MLLRGESVTQPAGKVHARKVAPRHRRLPPALTDDGQRRFPLKAWRAGWRADATCRVCDLPRRHAGGHRRAGAADAEDLRGVSGIGAKVGRLRARSAARVAVELGAQQPGQRPGRGSVGETAPASTAPGRHRGFQEQTAVTSASSASVGLRSRPSSRFAGPARASRPRQAALHRAAQQHGHRASAVVCAASAVGATVRPNSVATSTTVCAHVAPSRLQTGRRASSPSTGWRAAGLGAVGVPAVGFDHRDARPVAARQESAAVRPVRPHPAGCPTGHAATAMLRASRADDHSACSCASRA